MTVLGLVRCWFKSGIRGFVDLKITLEVVWGLLSILLYALL